MLFSTDASSAVSSDAFMALNKQGIVGKFEESTEERNKKILEVGINIEKNCNKNIR